MKHEEASYDPDDLDAVKIQDAKSALRKSLTASESSCEEQADGGGLLGGESMATTITGGELDFFAKKAKKLGRAIGAWEPLTSDDASDSGMPEEVLINHSEREALNVAYKGALDERRRLWHYSVDLIQKEKGVGNHHRAVQAEKMQKQMEFEIFEIAGDMVKMIDGFLLDNIMTQLAVFKKNP